MNRSITALFSFSLFFNACSPTSKPAEAPAQALKTLRITYDLTNSIQIGDGATDTKNQKVVSIDMAGGRLREETTYTRKGPMMEMTTRQIRFNDGKRNYMINSSRPDEAVYRDQLQSNRPIWEEPMIPGDTHKIGKETVAGKECDIYEIEPSAGIYMKSWIWNKIKLKELNRLKGIETGGQAVLVEENVPLSDDLFTLPPGMKAISSEEARERSKIQIEELKKKQEERKAALSSKKEKKSIRKRRS